jgi:hypothetical protein
VFALGEKPFLGPGQVSEHTPPFVSFRPSTLVEPPVKSPVRVS